MSRLLLIFVSIGLLDIYLLMKLAGVIGFAATVLAVLATGVLGSWLLRFEGGRVWADAQRALSEGRAPTEGALGGVLLLVGGALLISPGVVTDVMGLLLMVPVSRRAIASLVRPRLARVVEEGRRRGSVRVVTVGGPFGPRPGPERAPGSERAEVVGRAGRRIGADRPRPRRREVIDAEFEVSESRE